MKNTLRLMAIGLTGLSLSACAVPAANNAPQAVHAEQVFPITVEPQVATLVVQVDDGLQRLARGEERRIEAFAARWKARGQGLLTAAAPTDAPNRAAAAAAMQDIQKILAANGVDQKSMQVTSYRAAGDDANAPITLSFVTYAANAADCGTDWSENMAFTPRNMPWPEFGCSTQHNIAAIVSDPRDLVEPRASDTADAAKRGTMFEKYRRGEPTHQKEAKENSGQVSNVQQ